MLLPNPFCNQIKLPITPMIFEHLYFVHFFGHGDKLSLNLFYVFFQIFSYLDANFHERLL